MNRLKILVEGPTERLFVNEVLKPDLINKGIEAIPFLFQERGGITRYAKAQKQILNTIKADPSCFCTTLVDYYGLPMDWPGRRDSGGLRAYRDKAAAVEQALMQDICSQLGDSFNPKRLVPYVQMHEFEALLFSDVDILSTHIGEHTYVKLREVRDSFSCPEEINDNYQTCPSRRILSLSNKYEKIIDGTNIAQKIGLTVMRQQCPHFNQWLTKLESLSEKD